MFVVLVYNKYGFIVNTMNPKEKNKVFPALAHRI